MFKFKALFVFTRIPPLHPGKTSEKTRFSIRCTYFHDYHGTLAPFRYAITAELGNKLGKFPMIFFTDICLTVSRPPHTAHPINMTSDSLQNFS